MRGSDAAGTRHAGAGAEHGSQGGGAAGALQHAAGRVEALEGHVAPDQRGQQRAVAARCLCRAEPAGERPPLCGATPHPSSQSGFKHCQIMRPSAGRRSGASYAPPTANCRSHLLPPG